MKQEPGINSSFFPERKIPSTEHRRNETLRLIGENPGITTRELAKRVECVSATLKRHTLQPLAIDGQIHSNPKDCWHLGKRNGRT
ncbi:MAG TPA: hypothetical protein V6D11_14895 [Waterburya sp.]